MPKATGMKFHYDDHDTDAVDETPPILNNWYEVFHAQDVRLLWCYTRQSNDEAAVKTVEVRWTIDGTVYFGSFAQVSGTAYYTYRWVSLSAAGTSGLLVEAGVSNGAKYVDKRGKDFKVEVRITSALGTNQRLVCYCVRETLDLT